MFWPLLVVFAFYLLVFRAAGEVWARRWGKYSGQAAACGRSGEDVARQLLAEGGADDIRVARGRAHDTSRFDPSRKCVLLGPGVHDGRSIGALAVAAQAAVEALPGVRTNAAGNWRRSVVTFGRGGAGLVVLGCVFFALFRPILWRILPYAWVGCGLVLLAGHALTLGWEYQVAAEAMRRLQRAGCIGRGEEDAFEEMRKAVPLREVHGIGASLGRAFSALVPTKGWK